jgi:hypothetical protein
MVWALCVPAAILVFLLVMERVEEALLPSAAAAVRIGPGEDRVPVDGRADDDVSPDETAPALPVGPATVRVPDPDGPGARPAPPPLAPVGALAPDRSPHDRDPAVPPPRTRRSTPAVR